VLIEVLDKLYKIGSQRNIEFFWVVDEQKIFLFNIALGALKRIINSKK